ncbi:hypothetical protein SMZ52_000925 [Cronobacter sakazakii]|uniref:hypothetical protein n=1 Tax=Cronobacter sakazakii TaxID=28141 RepID=UPI0009772699|nr:hypothetical protein [Cronobacter sakazakii]ELY2811735.1 hypothetical protein [Cronobacter sakazakii]ELY3709437.1 hypothetical protein [Cronobacter sakazakii]ELY4420463.1 hypothetical protein [Cronobacter sakazakii]ELY4660500.1 hypothetical protein [Cronobacter sakazakii]ELY5846515.1 hypothetical protein [Cronobacter sakazakii]
MDKSREQFLEWFSKEYEEVNNSTELSAQVIKMIASAAWQASRAVIEIKLPTENELHQKVCSGCASESLEMVEQAIRAAGLKVKGE